MDPARDWVLLDYDVEQDDYGAKGIIKGAFEYAVGNYQSAMLRRSTRQITYPDSQVEVTSVIDYDLHLGSLPAESDFSLSAFGLAEPMGEGAQELLSNVVF